MKPVLSVEFVGGSNSDIREESLSFDAVEGFLAFVGPGGGCEQIPDSVEEVRVLFTPGGEDGLAGVGCTLEIGRLFITGTLQEVSEVASRLAALDQVSSSFEAMARR